jgi:hypothetical protein
MFSRIFRIATAQIVAEFNDWPSLCPNCLTCVKFPTLENWFRVFIPSRTTVTCVFLCTSVLSCVVNGKALGPFTLQGILPNAYQQDSESRIKRGPVARRSVATYRYC